ILTCAISTAKRTFAFPLYHRDATWSERDLFKIETALVNFLHSDCCKISFQLSFELEWLAYCYGDEIVHSKWGDGQAQAFLLDSRQGSLSLEFLCLQHFGINVKAINNTDRNRLDETDLETV